MKRFVTALLCLILSIFAFGNETIGNETKILYLENGIPVYLKNNEQAKVNTIEICFSTGASDLENNECGYLSFLLDLMTTETKKFSENKIIQLMDEKQGYISSGSLSEYCYISLTCLEKYFAQLYPIFESEITDLTMKRYEEKIRKHEFNLKNTKYIDNPLLMKLSGAALREQTNYFGKNSFTEESIEACSKEKIISLYEKMFRTDGIKIVCYGNYDEAELLKTLNKKIGKKVLIETDETEKEFNISFKDEITVFEKNEKNAVDFAIAYSNLPEPEDELFAACFVANTMYSDVLYAIVREKYGSCYSAYSNVNLSKKPIMITVGYRISDEGQFWNAIKEANQIFYSGKLVKSNENGNSVLIDAENKLESYKNILINRIYGESNTGKDKVDFMTMGLFMNGSTEFMDDLVKNIQKVDEKKLEQAIQYLSEQNQQWFYLTNIKSDTDM